MRQLNDKKNMFIHDEAIGEMFDFQSTFSAYLLRNFSFSLFFCIVKFVAAHYFFPESVYTLICVCELWMANIARPIVILFNEISISLLVFLFLNIAVFIQTEWLCVRA